MAAMALLAKPRGRVGTVAICIVSILIGCSTSAVWIVAFSTPPSPASEGNQPVVYPKNPELTRMFAATFVIERAIRADHTPGHWPTSLVSSPGGQVGLEGKTIVTLERDESLSYIVTENGTDFQLVLNGRIAGEHVFYDYNTHIIRGECDKSDRNCVGYQS